MKTHFVFRVLCLAFAIGLAGDERMADPARGAGEGPPRPNWDQAGEEAVQNLIGMIKIDTSGAAGNETKVAQFIKAILDKEGIASEILELQPGRGNLVARLKGNGSKRPLLLMGHTDVVGVERDKWTVDPFGGVVKDGYLYGRGALDNKDNVAVYLEVFLLLHRLGVPLDRDVIFLAQAGFRSNVIPAQAEARLDVRAVPDEDIDAMVATLRRLIDDPAVELVPPAGGRSVPPPSGIQTEMFRALDNAQRKLFPDAATLPVLLTGATDMAPLRARGVHAYGLDPPASIEESTRVHGNDERISVQSVRVFVEFVYEAVTALMNSR